MSDFLTLPEGLEPPPDDGAASHLEGRSLPRVELASTAGGTVDLGTLSRTAVIYFYPLTGRPGTPLPGGWDDIPGARGCTPQACSFRDLYEEFGKLGVSNIFGVLTQTTAWQKEAVERLHLPFPLLSDSTLELRELLDLPVMEVGDELLFKRLTLIALDSRIEAVFYPVFPPDRNAEDVLNWIQGRASR